MKLSSFVFILLNVDDEIVILDRLQLGMSNYIYLISVNDIKYTFRIPGEYADIFVDRNQELEGLKLIAPYNLCGETLYADEKGIKISRYIDGDVLQGNVKDDDYINVMKILKKLHSIAPININEYNPFNKLEYYEKLNGNNLSEKYLEVKNRPIYIIKEKK